MYPPIPQRIGPAPKPDDHVEHLWYAPGFVGDASFILIRPAGENRSYARYRLREFVRRGEAEFEMLSQELGGAWIHPKRDAVAHIEGCVRDLYANGFGTSPDHRSDFSLDHVVRRAIDRPRAALGRLLDEIADLTFGPSIPSWDF